MEELEGELRSLKQRMSQVEDAMSALRCDTKPTDSKAQPVHAMSAAPDRVERPLCLEPVAMAATRVVMHQLVPLSETDGLGICTGGQVLSWIDVCAGLTAKTLARGPCVTASVDAVHFLKPCRTGMVVIIAGMVNRSFASSMEVGVRVEAEDMRSGARHHCCSAYLTFVSLHARGPKGRPLPQVAPTLSEHRAIYDAAEDRRAARLKEREAVRADPSLAQAAAKCRLQPVTHREGCPTLPPPLRLQEGGAARKLPPSLTLVYMTQAIMPHHANTLGITFGGQVMRWMEQCAYISASRLRGGHFLTASMDSLAFSRPTKVGHILYLTAAVTAVFGSSLEVMISVFGEDPSADWPGQEGGAPEAEGGGGAPGRSGVFSCADAYATIVTVDDDGLPTQLPVELAPEAAEERLRLQGAVKRRVDRLAMRRALSRHQITRASLDGTPWRPSSNPSPSPAPRPMASHLPALRSISLEEELTPSQGALDPPTAPLSSHPCPHNDDPPSHPFPLVMDPPAHPATQDSGDPSSHACYVDEPPSHPCPEPCSSHSI